MHVHRVDPAAAVAEHNRVLMALRSGLVPFDKMAEARQYLSDLSIAARAPQLLMQTARRIVDQERRACVRVRDEEASADKWAVIQSMRGSTVTDAELPKPAAPDFSRMSDAEFRGFVEREYRYSPPV
jgi:hypothetical protein